MNKKKDLNIDIKNIRNFSISAHVDAGKTTLTEGVLFHAGIIHKRGNIDKQDTQMDWRIEEKTRGITIMSDATSCYWKGCYYNVIDTPGHRDFSAEVIRCFSSIDFVVGVFCGVGGVEPQTKFVWSKIEEHNLPVISFVNKLDRVGANFFSVVDEITNNFLIKSVPLIVPLGLFQEFIGFIDLINDKVIFNNGDKVSYEYFKNNIKEYIIKYPFLKNKCEEIFFNYILYKDFLFTSAGVKDNKLLITSLKKKLLNREITLVVGGSAKLDVGVVNFLNCINLFCPSPLDKTQGIFKLINKKDQTIIEKKFNDSIVFLYIFKIVFDDYLGRFTYVKIFSGSIKPGDVIYNVNNGKTEKISRIVKIHANKKVDLSIAKGGDIVGIVGLKYSYTNDTLSSEPKNNYELKRVTFPNSIINKSIKPKTKKDQDNLSEALEKVCLSDPTIETFIDYNTKEIILSGLGELHLDVVISMLKTKYKVDVIAGKPKIAYRETITNPVFEIEGSYIRQSGGRGHYAVISINLEKSDKKFEFVNKLRGQKLDRSFIPGIEAGLKEYMISGDRARCPVSNIKVTLLDGESHSVDSSELSFKNAAYDALKKAYLKSDPRMLEPIMKVTIVVPKEFLGVVLSDIYSKRGKIITNIEKQYDIFGKIIIKNIIEASIPLDNLNNYSDNLLALSKGQAVQSGMDFLKYEFIPDYLEEKKAKSLFSEFYKKK